MPTYPVSRTSDAVEVLHGVTIPDPYRWLEDGQSADTRQWTDAQNALTRSYLDAVPARERIRTRLDRLLTVRGPIRIQEPPKAPRSSRTWRRRWRGHRAEALRSVP